MVDTSSNELALEQEEYRGVVAGRALRLMKSDSEPATWMACWETVVCGRPAIEVAAEVGLTVNAVYVARPCATAPRPGRPLRLRKSKGSGPEPPV